MGSSGVDYTKLAEFLENLDKSGKPDDDRGPRLLWSAVVLSILTVVVVGLRVYTRLRILKFFGTDDYLNLCATAFALGLSSTAIEGVEIGGQGKHTWRILYDGAEGVEMLKTSVQIGYALQIFYNLSVGFSKAAVLFFLLRLQPTWPTRYSIYALLYAIALYTTATVIVTIVQCLPIGIQWEMVPLASPFDNPHCINKLMFSYLVPAFNMVFNVLIFSVPLTLVMKLDLPPLQKAGLAFSFLLGMVACIASVMSLINTNKLFRSLDPQYDAIPTTIWLNAEAHMFIICTNLPILRPLLGKMWVTQEPDSPHPLPDVPNTARTQDHKPNVEMWANSVSPFEDPNRNRFSNVSLHDELQIGTAIGPESPPSKGFHGFDFRPETARTDFGFGISTDLESAHAISEPTTTQPSHSFLNSAPELSSRRYPPRHNGHAHSVSTRNSSLDVPQTASSSKPFFAGDPKVFG